MISFDIFIKIILGYTQDIIIESNTSNNADMVDVADAVSHKLLLNLRAKF